ncbi:unnamed protein product [Orchesella dallaii]|uniref:Uncharacterized protein n=1 Tax=Orchesella dallaii TaxID=48710 RepID=A0ABP1QUT6_9HEXA
MLQVVTKFYKLKHFVSGMNERFRMLVLCSTAVAVPFYSKKFGEIFLSHATLHYTTAIISVVYFTWIFLCLIIAASVSRTVQNVNLILKLLSLSPFHQPITPFYLVK